MFKIVDSKGERGLCKAFACSNKPGIRDYLCAKHRHRYKKETNPVAYHYDALKCNAKRRGKDFTLTLEDFREFCDRTRYLELKGRHKNAASIDRIDDSRGYHKDNIQVLTLSANTMKAAVDKKVREECPF